MDLVELLNDLGRVVALDLRDELVGRGEGMFDVVGVEDDGNVVERGHTALEKGADQGGQSKSRVDYKREE